ncbi:hypothetical protein KIW84_010316 [Lathyrus oleraceus]|uniref:Neprosin PEP catalytic domain-containing protein n=1 Tax=Pisum sativum TaxID=3888 RepID=A0A9D5BE18_PEA|nr:hypothetical protein KIW84_010316 [Pisum sativum]
MQSELKDEDLELERQLNILNKSPIKSFHIKSGYIVDCIDINKQPAFDNPLLKNHKLQRKPLFERNITERRIQNSSKKSRFILEKVRCPQGTVPIRRTTKNDLIQGKYLFNAENLTQNSALNHFSRLNIKYVSTLYYGVSGTTSVWNPKVYKGQSSSGNLYVLNGEGDNLNKISIGWHDNIGNWWLKVRDKDIGYFPAALFSNLFEANEVGWGGYTVTPAGTTSPAMGSGYYPDEDITHASYFKFLKYLNIFREHHDPYPFMIYSSNDAPKCYGLANYEDKRKDLGFFFQFGGPGGNCRS